MNPTSSDTTDSLAVIDGIHVPAQAGEPTSGAGGGRHARVAMHRPMVVRAPRPDYRLRSLATQSGGAVPTMSTRMRGWRKRRRATPRIAGAVCLLAVTGLAALMINGFVVQPYSVPGNAMMPTFQAGDRILVANSGVLASPIRTGEIVVFRPRQDLPCSVVGARGGDLVRRVVAVPGETIWSVGGRIFVDGRPLRDGGWYDARFGPLGSTPIVSTRLGHGQYYVMTDNRSDACDSRAFGPISRSSIVGAGIAIVARGGHVFVRTL